MTADVVPPELLEIPSPQERRHLDRDLCAGLLDRLLRRLARQEALCRRVLGRLARHFLAKRAHQRLGFVRLDDFARERLGLSGRELQELAHVAQRLEVLPALARAFAQGALSWSHLRLLVSVATPDTEAAWLARARGESVRALEAAIAATRGVPPDPDERAVDGESPGRFHLRCPRRVRRLWHHATELASRMSGARLPAWRAAEAIAAEGLASDEADGVARSDPPPAPRRDAATAPPPSPSPPSGPPIPRPPGWTARSRSGPAGSPTWSRGRSRCRNRAIRSRRRRPRGRSCCRRCRCVRAAPPPRCGSRAPPRSWRSSGRPSAPSRRRARRPGRASSASSST